MDESLTSDLDSDSETECRALVGETGRPETFPLWLRAQGSEAFQFSSVVLKTW